MDRSILLVALAIAIQTIASTAHGQEGFQPSAAAEALFQEGKELMARGRHPEACAKFEASVRIERAVGAVLNLADCHERVGRTASAWSEYRDAASDAERTGDAVRARFANRRAAELQPSLSRLLVGVDGAAEGLTVRVNGRELARDAWSSAVPVDPGSLTVEAAKPGFRMWRATVHVPPHDSVSMRVPSLEPLVVKKESRQLPTTAGPDRTTFYLVAGTSATLLVLGAGFGIQTLATQAKVDDRCGNRYCDATGLELEREAKTYATLSTIGLGAGAALTGVAAYLWFSKPREGRPSASMSVGPGCATLQGSF